MKTIVFLFIYSLVASSFSTIPLLGCRIGSKDTHKLVHSFHSCKAQYNFADNTVILSGQVNVPLKTDDTDREGCIITLDSLNTTQFVANCTCMTSECNTPMTAQQLLAALSSESCSDPAPTTSTPAPTTQSYPISHMALILKGPLLL